MQIFVTVSEDYDQSRLDVFLKDNAGDDLSRSTVQKWIDSGFVTNKTKDQVVHKNGYKVTLGEEYVVDVIARPPSRLEPIPMDIPVLYDEEEFMVIHKKAGIACHSGPGDDSPSLVNGLLHQFKNLSGTGGERRPGIVHRLDKPTEGVLIIAKTDRAHAALSKLFQDRLVDKTYYAWVLQAPVEAEGTISLPIGRHPVERVKMCVREDGRMAITHYRTEKIVQTQTGRKFSLMKLGLETGRTHQIRVHMAKIGCPVVGDSLYSRSAKDYTQYGLLLFAKKLDFPHPFVPDKRIVVELEFPERFKIFERKCPSY
ncbi:23S rRNA pseudouridylate synthase [Leptospira levettii]|uniref:RluA family pseudouridine synthase n=1 Tax=Leptospira levettii TaxID=2023178 RepID=UPI000C2A1E65|nr:RluA family pseudouridine synthase [Leptospira levettii]MCW7474593.1 RluA family pseudouridine synthase [Leptospira levettii]PJZ38899.1 23S rRNA pseudouridylate synthase [Leptospira levettii]PJZ87168.1 23S rRNA pseudouridylate synthase [Leptospira levettii]